MGKSGQVLAQMVDSHYKMYYSGTSEALQIKIQIHFLKAGIFSSYLSPNAV